jgi:hypothetical protein
VTKNKGTIDSHNVWMKPDPKGYILCDSTYVKLENLKVQSSKKRLIPRLVAVGK